MILNFKLNEWHKKSLFEYKVSELSNEKRLIVMGYGKRKRILNMSLPLSDDVTPKVRSIVDGAIKGYMLWYPDKFRAELNELMSEIYPNWKNL